MSEKNIKSRIVHKHDIESHWNLATNFIPKQGEIIVYDTDDNYNYERFKIGDGKTLVSLLPFVNDNKVDKIDGSSLFPDKDIDRLFDEHYHISFTGEEYDYPTEEEVLNRISETVGVTFSSRLCRISVSIEVAPYPIYQDFIMYETIESDTSHRVLFGAVNPNLIFSVYYDCNGGGFERVNLGGSSSEEIEAIKETLDKKVDKVSGKGLSSNDFTDDEKEKLKKLFPLTETKLFHYSEVEDLISYLNSKTGQGIEIINWDEDEIGNEHEYLIFSWGATYEDHYVAFQTLIYPNGKILRRQKRIDTEEEWTSVDDFSDEWQKISVSQTDLDKKVDKVKGKRLISDEINMVANNVFSDIDEDFDEVIKLNEDFDPTTHVGPLFGGAEDEGIFKILDKNNNFIGILERTYYDNYPNEAEGYFIANEWFEDLNGVVWHNFNEDGGYQPWYVDNSHKIHLKDKIFQTKEIPNKLSDLYNDLNYVTKEDVINIVKTLAYYSPNLEEGSEE